MSEPVRTKRALRKLAKTLKQPLGAAPITGRLATVDHVTAGAAADGNAAAFIALNSDVVAADYLASYTPTAGDLVLVLFLDGKAPVIVGQVIGLPSF